MNKYRVHFAPLGGDSTCIELFAEDCNDAIQSAIELAKDPETGYDPEFCTRIDVSGVWKDNENHWLTYSWDSGHWQPEKRILKPSVTPVEVLPAPEPTIENLAKLAEFLGWLADLYDAEDLGLVACDDELAANFSKIRDIYPAVLAAVKTKGGSIDES